MPNICWGDYSFRNALPKLKYLSPHLFKELRLHSGFSCALHCVVSIDNAQWAPYRVKPWRASLQMIAVPWDFIHFVNMEGLDVWWAEAMSTSWTHVYDQAPFDGMMQIIIEDKSATYLAHVASGESTPCSYIASCGLPMASKLLLSSQSLQRNNRTKWSRR